MKQTYVNMPDNHVNMRHKSCMYVDINHLACVCMCSNHIFPIICVCTFKNSSFNFLCINFNFQDTTIFQFNMQHNHVHMKHSLHMSTCQIIMLTCDINHVVCVLPVDINHLACVCMCSHHIFPIICVCTFKN